MTEASLSAGAFTEADFSAGRALERTWSVLSRNFPAFFVVTVIASLPKYLFTFGVIPAPDHWLQALLLTIFATSLWVVIATLSQAMVLYGAFQAMRGRGFGVGESLRLGSRRIFAVIGVAITLMLFGSLGLIVFVVPGLMFFAMSFVALPACVVEERGVSSSMTRSAQLTKGHRWKMFALMMLIYIVDTIVDGTIDQILGSAESGIPAFAGHMVWSAIRGAFYAILVVVTYHDLRVAKEGIDTAGIAAVFE
ncbi:MAG TPA: hypothetical protein VIY51_03715 [Xanthobacteraceae bacterium]